MFPVLFSFYPVTIYTLSLFVLLAFFFSGYVFWRKGREEHYEEEELFDSFLIVTVWGVVVSRLAFILLHFSHFQFSFLKWIDIFTYPGLVPVIGLIASIWLLYRHAVRKKWEVLEILDFAALAISSSLVLVSLGSFFDGSGFGTVTKLPWGVIFPAVFDPRHPTQLYGALFYLLLTLYLQWLEPKYRMFSWYRNKRNTAPAGFLFAVFCIGYGLFGLFVSLINPVQNTLFEVNIELPIRLLILLFGVVRLVVQSGRGQIAFPKKSKSATVIEDKNT